MCEVITFFDKKKEYRVLSNFWECEVRIKDEGEEFVYLSGELCFHGEKYRILGTLLKDEDRKIELLEYSKRFRVGGDFKSSREAKIRGGKCKNGLRLNSGELVLWNMLCENVQYEICKYKLENYAIVKEWLLKSGDSILVHPAMRCGDKKMKDKFWEGRAIINEDGKIEILGGNKLGGLWMKLRDELVV